MKQRKELAERDIPGLSKRRRCALLGVNISSLYLKKAEEKEEKVTLMNDIQTLYAHRPTKGYRRICFDLTDIGYVINKKRVLRVMQEMGLQAIYPKKNLSKRRQEDAVHPYLLKALAPLAVHDCWSVDITYIRVGSGYVYLTALIDIVSRHIMGWELSTYLDADTCVKAFEKALQSGYKPVIVNSDQGCQFTGEKWVQAVQNAGCLISMDGKGRCLDNIFIERFWRALKYEEVYLRSYESVQEARESLGEYIEWYNRGRRHQSLGYITPYAKMMESIGIKVSSVDPFLADLGKSKLENGSNADVTTSVESQKQVLSNKGDLSSNLAV